MPRYSVQLPITGYVHLEVDANSEAEAIAIALQTDVTKDDIEEWETHEYTNRGNVAYGSCTQANAEPLD